MPCGGRVVTRHFFAFASDSSGTRLGKDDPHGCGAIRRTTVAHRVAAARELVTARGPEVCPSPRGRGRLSAQLGEPGDPSSRSHGIDRRDRIHDCVLLRAIKDQTVVTAILERGGGGNVVNQVASHLRQELVGNVANLAAQGDKAAQTAIKIVKQAKRLGQNC